MFSICSVTKAKAKLVPECRRTTPPIGAYDNQIFRDQRIPMKAGLIPILLDVITPPDFTGLSVEGVEYAGTGTDENEISHNRRS